MHSERARMERTIVRIEVVAKRVIRVRKGR